MTACRIRRIAGTVLLLFLSVGVSGAEEGIESRLSEAVSFTDRSGPSVPKVVSWRNPATYEDGTEIPDASRARIETRLYFSLDFAEWTRFATVSGGAESWRGILPVGKEVPAYYAATATIPDDGTADPLDLFTVAIGNYRDTHVASGEESDTNYSTDILIRSSLGPDRRVSSRGILQWDLSSLPDDAMVIGASLRLYHAGETGGPDGDVCAVKVAKFAGADPDPVRATWNSPDSLVGWTGGADGGSGDLAPAESVASVGKNPAWVVWNVTNMVQQWVEEPGTNRGMALDPDTKAAAGTSRFFASREHPDPFLRPELEITYRRDPQVAMRQEGAAPQLVWGGEESDASEDAFTVEIGRFGDTFVNHSVYSDINYSAEPLIHTYTWPENHVANRGLIRWDLSGLPSGIDVKGATLHLYYADEDGGGGDEDYTVTVSAVTGVRPEPGLATWNTYDGSSPWPGGQNGGAEVLSSVKVSSTIGKTHRWVSWDVTDIVRGWVAERGTKFSMVIDSDASASRDSNRYFASREYPDPRLRPRLLITYTKPR